MTISLLQTLGHAAIADAHEHMVCDLCGREVFDPAAHLAACVEHEMNLFAIGRAS